MFPIPYLSPRSLTCKMLLCAALSIAPLMSHPAYAGDTMVDFAAEDSVMNTAMDQARATLPLFLSHAFDSNGTGNRAAEIKVAYETNQADYTEIIWINNLRLLKNGRIAGRFANEPNYIAGKHLGDETEFDRADIRDWGLWQGNKLWGHYTTRVIATQLEGKQRAELEQILSPTALPKGWSVK